MGMEMERPERLRQEKYAHGPRKAECRDDAEVRALVGFCSPDQ